MLAGVMRCLSWHVVRGDAMPVLACFLACFLACSAGMMRCLSWHVGVMRCLSWHVVGVMRCLSWHVSILQRIRQDVATLLDKEAINAACREEKYTWKDRLLNPANTIHLFIIQVLNQNTPINDVPRKSGESFTGSAYCKARKRLRLGIFKSLVRRLADTLLPRSGSAHADDDEGRWFGHRTFVMDGSSCSMPDTPELQREFGQPGNQRPGCGFPVAHLMVLFQVGTGLLRELLTSPLRTHDMSQAVQLHPALQPGDIGLGDRGFCSYAHLVLLSLRRESLSPDHGEKPHIGYQVWASKSIIITDRQSLIA